MNMKKIIPLTVGCIMIIQSLSAFAYTDISMKTIREKQLEFASQYEYHKGDFDKSFDLYPGIIYTSGIEYTKDGKTYHWTKAICQICGTLNPSDGVTDYNFNNNVYSLNSCDHNFFLDFDSSTCEQYSDEYHLTTLKRGEYCKFCKGTFAKAARGLNQRKGLKKLMLFIRKNT